MTQANGTADLDTAAEMLADAARFGDASITVGADKSYDAAGFAAMCRAHGVTPHAAQYNDRAGGSAIDGRTTCWADYYAVSQRKRNCIE